MNSKKYEHDPQELKNALEAALETGNNEKFLLRLRCVLDALNGRPAEDIATEFNCTVRTIQLWVNTLDKNFDSKGFESLRPRKSTGRKRKLSENQINEINNIILTTFPFEYGLRFVYWTGDRLAKALSDAFPDVHITSRNCRELLQNANYQKEYDFPINLLKYILTDVGIDAAKELLAFIRSDEPEETIMKEYNKIKRQKAPAQNTPTTSEPDIPEDDDEDDYDEED